MTSKRLVQYSLGKYVDVLLERAMAVLLLLPPLLLLLILLNSPFLLLAALLGDENACWGFSWVSSMSA